MDSNEVRPPSSSYSQAYCYLKADAQVDLFRGFLRQLYLHYGI